MKEWIFRKIVLPIWEEELIDTIIEFYEEITKSLGRNYGRVRKSSKKSSGSKRSKGGKNASI